MIYLDNSATSPIAQEVFAAMRPYLQEEYGNPSSKYYPLAAHAADAVENSRSWVAKLIHAKPEEIIFTCGSTESTNMIIKGVAAFIFVPLWGYFGASIAEPSTWLICMLFLLVSFVKVMKKES